MSDCMIINTENLEKPTVSDNLYQCRANFYKSLVKDAPEASICIQGFNRIEKTKICVEYVLEHTKDINYELILIDSGSTDGTFEFFQGVDYPNKKIIKITKNMGLNFAFQHILKAYTSNFLVMLPNDVYVTKNWLLNLLTCIRSDDKIGMVSPMSTNVSNKQSVTNISSTTLGELQQAAAKKNVSNPLLWERRMRLIPLPGIYRREALDLTGAADVGFIHDFSEDDWSLRFRRAGYDLVFCGDTLVHHDHNLSEPKEKHNESLRSGRKHFSEKYFGLDAWDDVTNFELSAIAILKEKEVNSIAPNILGIDVKMGTPILEICNLLRKKDIETVRTNAFTTHAKYYCDLQTVCNGEVACDRIEFIDDYFNQSSFDYILLGKPINCYDSPIKLFKKLLDMTSIGGHLIVKLRNVGDMRSLLFLMGQQECIDSDMPVTISLKNLIDYAQKLHINDYELSVEGHNVDEISAAFLRELVEVTKITKDIENVANNLQIQNFVICFEK